MTRYDFTAKKQTGVDVITFGTPEKKVDIDVTFIPALTSYRLKELLVKDESGRYTPESYAKIIALFTDEVDAAWIVENTTYSTLDQIVAIIVNKAFARTEPEEKN